MDEGGLAADGMRQTLAQRIAVRAEILNDIVASAQNPQRNVPELLGGEEGGQHILIADHVQGAGMPILPLGLAIFIGFEECPPFPQELAMCARHAHDAGIEGEGQHAPHVEAPHAGP
jgi:hypothetical protein